MERIIGHMDLDAFFAAVEEQSRPWARGLPIAVGADPLEGRGRGVVSTANYRAREYGIHSALPIGRAWELSEKAVREGKPRVIFFRSDFQKYEKVSQEVMAILKKYSPLVEQASIDEAYFDLSAAGDYQQASAICSRIKEEIKVQEKITASIGLGPNKLIAKIASDMHKPDGLTVVEPEAVEKFLDPLLIRKIPGIGPKTELRLNQLGIFQVADIKKLSAETLQEMLGKWGLALFEKARGQDDAPLAEDHEAKSIGEQETFFQDASAFGGVWEKMEALCQGVFDSFKASDFKSYKTIAVTVRFADFGTKTRSHTLKKPARLLKTLKAETLRLLLPFFDQRENPRRQKIRLVGVRIEKLV